MAGTLLLICSICRQFVNDQPGDPLLIRRRAKVSFMIPLICTFFTVHLAILFPRLYRRSLPLAADRCHGAVSPVCDRN